MLIKNPLRAAKITLRNYKKADMPYVTAMWFDDENGKYMIDPTKECVDSKYRSALDKLEDSEDGYYLTAVSNDSNEIVGSCCIFPDEKRECFDIGYCIRKDHWRKGLGTEVISLVIDWVIEQGGTQITAEVAKENVASCRLLQKNGFKVLRDASFKKYNMDISYDSYVFALDCKDVAKEK